MTPGSQTITYTSGKHTRYRLTWKVFIGSTALYFQQCLEQWQNQHKHGDPYIRFGLIKGLNLCKALG